MTDSVRFGASNPRELRLVTERADGSGVIEIPLLSVGVLEFEGKRPLDVTTDMLDEIAANFAAYPGPVPVGIAEHVDFGARGGPQPGFIELVYRKKDQLWGRLDLNSSAFSLVVRERSLRGFSVEMYRDLILPSREFRGWVLTGGVFTNRPASDVVFKVAAEAMVAEAVGLYAALDLSGARGKNMADDTKVVSLATHEAKVAEVRAEAKIANDKASAFEARVVALEAEIKSARAELETAKAEQAKAETDKITASATANRLEAEAKRQQATIRELNAKLSEVGEQLAAEKTANVSAKVKEIVEGAIEHGAAPALFDGYEADPAAWLSANFASLEAFEKHVGIIQSAIPKPTRLDAKAKASGSRESMAAKGADEPKLTDDEKAALEAKNVKLAEEFIGVRDAAEARKIHEARLAAKK